MWNRLNDSFINIRTEDYTHSFSTPNSWRGIDDYKRSLKHPDNKAYATINYYYLRKVIHGLNPKPDDVICDIGSGLGRIICVIARKKVKKCVGVEISATMCEHALGNVRAMRGRKSPIEVLCQDAATAKLDDGTIYFLFNPFGAETMTDVIENIGKSVHGTYRHIRIVYYNPVHRHLLDSCAWLETYLTMATFSGMQVVFYRSKESRGSMVC